jgi:hypothetical protein
MLKVSGKTETRVSILNDISDKQIKEDYSLCLLLFVVSAEFHLYGTKTVSSSYKFPIRHQRLKQGQSLFIHALKAKNTNTAPNGLPSIKISVYVYEKDKCILKIQVLLLSMVRRGNLVQLIR